MPQQDYVGPVLAFPASGAVSSENFGGRCEMLLKLARQAVERDGEEDDAGWSLGTAHCLWTAFEAHSQMHEGGKS